MVIAATASTTGTARGTMQGSWRPSTVKVLSSIEEMLMVCCSLAMDGVGFMPTRKTMGIPVEMPPKIPPALFVTVRTVLRSMV